MLGGIDLEILAVLAALAMLAGFIDAIAGGGGLITLPALLLAGIDPVAAIATNKLQAAAATISATLAFARKGLITWRSSMPLAIMAGVGGSAGALSVSILPRSALETVVPLLLILVALYFAFAPKLSNEQTRARLSTFAFTLVIAPTIGFYDGLFGPGVGAFFLIAFISLLGQGMLRAMSNTKLANAASNVGALLVFAANGAIIIPLALAMAAGAFIGAQAGAYCAVKFGSRLIKPLLIIICCGMAIKLLATPGNPLRQALLS